MGDLNSKVGSNNTGNEKVMGMHGCDLLNENGVKQPGNQKRHSYHHHEKTMAMDWPCFEKRTRFHSQNSSSLETREKKKTRPLQNNIALDSRSRVQKNEALLKLAQNRNVWKLFVAALCANRRSKH